ncbi:hypothetical protein AMTR_s00086p00105150 [Amborella trichopoda]|uniref:Uncharacterized protein n=1 Tax=Amborella trichopoda TaxID=13333 RepID=W1P4F6_AMBTC|nr:hypothetical protein AMTR_s00086p00105150 [Amborella trichopoda]
MTVFIKITTYDGVDYPTQVEKDTPDDVVKVDECHEVLPQKGPRPVQVLWWRQRRSCLWKFCLLLPNVETSNLGAATEDTEEEGKVRKMFNDIGTDSEAPLEVTYKSLVKNVGSSNGKGVAKCTRSSTRLAARGVIFGGAHNKTVKYVDATLLVLRTDSSS